MKQAPHRMESTEIGAVLYMALELSARRWQLAFGSGWRHPADVGRSRRGIAKRCGGRSQPRNANSPFRRLR